jgi:hypothetical protein
VAPLREGDALRQSVARQLDAVRGSLDELMIDKPKRRILRGTSARMQEGGS